MADPTQIEIIEAFIKLLGVSVQVYPSPYAAGVVMVDGPGRYGFYKAGPLAETLSVLQQERGTVDVDEFWTAIEGAR